MALAISQLHGFNIIRRAAAGGGGVSPIDLQYRGSFIDTVSKTVFTTGTRVIGPTSPNKIVLLHVYGLKASAGTLTVSAVNIGGNAATLLVPSSVGNTVSSAQEYHALWGCNAGTLTSVIGQVTFGSLVSPCYMDMWSMDHAITMTPQAIGTQLAVNPATLSVPMAMPANGCIVCSVLAKGIPTGGGCHLDGVVQSWNGSSGPTTSGMSTAGGGVIADNDLLYHSPITGTNPGLYAGMLVASFR